MLILLFISSETLALTFSTAVKKPNHSLLVKDGSDVVTYVPNSSFHLSTKISAPYFFFQYSFKIPNSNFGKSDVGNDDYVDSRLGIYFGNTLLEGFYKKYKGFSSTENGGKPGCTSCLVRNELGSQLNLIQFMYPLNRSFDLRASVSGANQSIKSDFSWILNIFYSRLKVTDGLGIVQGEFIQNRSYLTDISQLELRQYGIGFGPGLTWSVGSYFYIAGISSLGFGYQENIYIKSDIKRRLDEYGANLNIRFTFGTHNPVVNTGIRAHVVSNFYDIGEELSLTSVDYELRLYLSVSL